MFKKIKKGGIQHKAIMRSDSLFSDENEIGVFYLAWFKRSEEPILYLRGNYKYNQEYTFINNIEKNTE